MLRLRYVVLKVSEAHRGKLGPKPDKKNGRTWTQSLHKWRTKIIRRVDMYCRHIEPILKTANNVTETTKAQPVFSDISQSPEAL